MKKELFVPGRTELAGNHTDHQNGRVLASAIDLGLYAVCETNGSKMIHVQSEGFKTTCLSGRPSSVRPRLSSAAS